MTGLKMKKPLEPWIETYSGKKFWFLKPTPEMIDIDDIAHALAMQCRYTGHVKHFYSVAEHSVHVSNLAKNKLEGLLHDASEAFLTDIASPIKPHLANYKSMEETIMVAIGKLYGFNWPVSQDTKDADSTQLKTEARHLLPSGGRDWLHEFPTQRVRGVAPKCWTPDQAKMAFLERFYELTEDTNVVHVRAA
jgi:uncharacterized protein